MAQVLPTPPAPEDKTAKAPAGGKVVSLDTCRKGKEAAAESVAILSLFLG